MPFFMFSYIGKKGIDLKPPIELCLGSFLAMPQHVYATAGEILENHFFIGLT